MPSQASVTATSLPDATGATTLSTIVLADPTHKEKRHSHGTFHLPHKLGHLRIRSESDSESERDLPRTASDPILPGDAAAAAKKADKHHHGEKRIGSFPLLLPHLGGGRSGHATPKSPKSPISSEPESDDEAHEAAALEQKRLHKQREKEERQRQKQQRAALLHQEKESRLEEAHQLDVPLPCFQSGRRFATSRGRGDL